METSSPSWDDLKVLLAVHRSRSFLGASRTLGVSVSTATRRMTALEAAVGRKLVVRTSQGTFIAPGAEGLLQVAETFENQLAALERASSVEGVVKLTAGDGFGGVLVEVLGALHRNQPDLSFELVLENRRAAIARREADIGIRTVRSRSADLVERRLGELELGLFGDRRRAEQLGLPRMLGTEELERAPFVAHLGDSGLDMTERWLRGQGVSRFALRTSSPRAAYDAIEQGFGLGIMPVVVAERVASLSRFHPHEALPPLPCWAVVHRELRNAPRIRVVVDALVAAFEATVPQSGRV